MKSWMDQAAMAFTHFWKLVMDEDYCLLADFTAEPTPGLTWTGAARPPTRKMAVEELRELSHHTRRLRVGTETRKLTLAELLPPPELGVFEPELATDSERVLWPELELGEFELRTYPFS